MDEYTITREIKNTNGVVIANMVVSWSDWGGYHLIALTNETSKAGIAMNSDNLVLFGLGKRADATGGWKV
nr:hypothetical protein LBZUJACN_LBZUJACN_CDS_0067 [Caudoviricetes sp.]CAI9751114.1 hypothetical protein MIHLRAQX_MIHLRAQX_CDS_0067 [Caudoviricetes sp.]